eukprot:2848726-Alexandrium_andersonii.AAC.1
MEPPSERRNLQNSHFRRQLRNQREEHLRTHPSGASGIILGAAPFTLRTPEANVHVRQFMLRALAIRS